MIQCNQGTLGSGLLLLRSTVPCSKVEPLNEGHNIGIRSTVPFRETVLISEVKIRGLEALL